MIRIIFQFTSILVFLFAAKFTYGQEYSYIQTDSIISTGVKIIRKNDKINSKYIEVKNKGEIQRYTPDNLVEYAFEDGPIYESRIININNEYQRVFLEKVVSGKLNLYRYIDEAQEIFYLQQDSSRLINLENNRKTLETYIKDCEFSAAGLKLVKFNKKSLKKLIEDYNDCKESVFPVTRKGVLIGSSFNQLRAPNNFRYEFYEEMPISTISSILVGLYIDTPILMSDYSFTAGIQFQKIGYSSHIDYEQSVFDVILNHSSLRIPILIKYRVQKIGLRPFFNLGGNFNYHFINDSKIYQTVQEEEYIIINEKDYNNPVSDYYIGYSIGAGIEYNLDFKRIISAEVRLYQSLGIDESLHENSLQFLIGFSF